MRTLLIDNFDSYTYNIWQLLSEVNGEEPTVVYNNAFNYNWDELLKNYPPFDNIVISPGPGSPDVYADFGICADAILRSDLPVLGVCLGHQGIAHHFGGVVNRAKVPMHGRLSSISHTNEGLFYNIPQETKVVRYHSLVVENDALPSELVATAWTADDIIMGLKHVSKPIHGVQFHPESISTECGRQIFTNFKDLTERYHFDLKQEKLKVDNKDMSSSENYQKTKHHTNKVESTQKQNVVDTNSVINSRKRHIYIAKQRFPVEVNVKSVFEELYGDSSASFWLDSSSFGPIQGRSDNSTPLSFFGDLDSSDESYAIEYHGSNRLTKRMTKGLTENYNQNIFEYLDNQLEENKNVADVVHFYEGQDGNSERPIFLKNSGIDLPFNLTSAYFGFLGYETRHEAAEILTQPYSSPYERYNFSATHSEDFQSSKWKDNMSHPMAFFMRPSEYVVYDHKENAVYVVSTTDPNLDEVCAEGSNGYINREREREGVSAAVTAITAATVTAAMIG
jgi:para-aminobenzoate synthetase